MNSFNKKWYETILKNTKMNIQSGYTHDICINKSSRNNVETVVIIVNF